MRDFPIRSGALPAVLLALAAAASWGQPAAPAGGTLFVESIDAVVNDEIILAGEVEERLGLIAINTGISFENRELYERTRRRILEEMINDLLIYQWGVENELGLRKDQLERRVESEIQFLQETEEVKRRGGLEAYLEQVGRSMESLRKTLSRRIQREFVINQAVRMKVEDKLHVTDASIERFKVHHPDVFQKEQKVMVRQIFLRCPEKAPAERESEVAAQAEQIYLQIKAGADFTEMVRRYSDHEATRKQDGEMPPYSRGELAKPFDAAFELERGDICRPFRTAAGYHILRLEKKQAIDEYLIAEQKREKLNEWLEELREDAVIVVKPPAAEL